MTKVREDDWIEHQTPDGLTIYSPQYSDENYVYRHIKLSSRAFRSAKNLMLSRGKNTLSASEVTQDLQIPMSLDWQHYATHAYVLK